LLIQRDGGREGPTANRGQGSTSPGRGHDGKKKNTDKRHRKKSSAALLIKGNNEGSALTEGGAKKSCLIQKKASPERRAKRGVPRRAIPREKGRTQRKKLLKVFLSVSKGKRIEVGES